MQHVGNLALSYEKSRLTARFSMNYSGKYIEEVGDDSDTDEWRDAATTLDFSGTYRVGKSFDIFFQWNNITNEVRYNYIGIPSRAREHGINGSAFDLGVKWTL
jgi:outer membrane receptor protein involved in Fe transport